MIIFLRDVHSWKSQEVAGSIRAGSFPASLPLLFHRFLLVSSSATILISVGSLVYCKLQNMNQNAGPVISYCLHGP
jgi:hypothetical protein